MKIAKFVVCLIGMAVLLLTVSSGAARAGGDSSNETSKAVTTFTGTISTAFTITMSSTLPTGGPNCLCS